MGEPDRDGLAFFDLAVVPDGDVGTDLDRPAFVIEEPESVAAARGLDGAGLADQLHPGGGQPPGQGVHVRGAGRAEGDQVDPLVVGLPEPDHILLGGTLGGQERQAGVAVLGLQAHVFVKKSSCLP